MLPYNQKVKELQYLKDKNKNWIKENPFWPEYIQNSFYGGEMSTVKPFLTRFFSSSVGWKLMLAFSWTQVFGCLKITTTDY